MKVWERGETFLVILCLVSALRHTEAAGMLTASSSLAILGNNPHTVTCRFNVDVPATIFHELVMFIKNTESDNRLAGMASSDTEPEWFSSDTQREVGRRATLTGSRAGQYIELIFNYTRPSDNGSAYLCQVMVIKSIGVVVGDTQTTVIKVVDPGDVVKLTIEPESVTQYGSGDAGRVTFTCATAASKSGYMITQMSLSKVTASTSAAPDKEATTVTTLAFYNFRRRTVGSVYESGFATLDKSGFFTYTIPKVTCEDAVQYRCNVALKLPLASGGEARATEVMTFSKLNVIVLPGQVVVSTDRPRPDLHVGTSVVITCVDVTPVTVLEVELIWEYQRKGHNSWTRNDGISDVISSVDKQETSCQKRWTSNFTHVMIKADLFRQYRCQPRRNWEDYLQDAELFRFQLRDGEQERVWHSNTSNDEGKNVSANSTAVVTGMGQAEQIRSPPVSTNVWATVGYVAGGVSGFVIIVGLISNKIIKRNTKNSESETDSVPDPTSTSTALSDTSSPEEEESIRTPETPELSYITTISSF